MSVLSTLHNDIPTIDIIKERFQSDYLESEQRNIKRDACILLLQLERNIANGKSVIFENQEKAAYEIVEAFKDRKILNVMTLALTQGGKTGIMCAFIQKYLEDPSNLIPTENIYFITGLSSTDWLKQTADRIPEDLRERIFHRNDLTTTFVNQIKNKKNVLIIMDEVHVAAKENQTICKAFRDAGLLDRSTLYENDIKIVECTATPDGTIYDLMKWKDASTKIIAPVGETYTSAFDLLEQGRVNQCKDLFCYDKTTDTCDHDKAEENISEIKNDIETFSGPLYHIIRTKTGKDQEVTISHFKCLFGVSNYEYKPYNATCSFDLNGTLCTPPEKHTFIFIKEMLRCAITLQKDYIGVVYDRYCESIDDSTIIQGLLGRCTGYNDNGRTICYTNIDTIVRYKRLYDSGFEDTSIRWNSKTTVMAKGILSSRKTFNCPNDSDDDSNELNEPVIIKFKTQEEVKEYFNQHLKPKIGGNGPTKRKPKNHGFYEACIRSKSKVCSTNEIHHERRYGLYQCNYRLYPCYENIHDKDTLQWWFIHCE